MNEDKRFHSFDIIRAVAMLAGIPFHACLAYMVSNQYWVVTESSTSFSMDYFSYFIRIFRMPLFFFIAGFFSCLVNIKRPESFFRDRYKRLFIPLIISSLLILPFLKFLWIAGEYSHIYLNGEYQLFLDKIIQSYWAKKGANELGRTFSFAHLWFIYYLFLFSILTSFLKKLPSSKTLLSIVKKNYSSIGISLTFLSLFLMYGSWIDHPFRWYPRPSLILYYGIFYWLGWITFNIRNDFNKIFVDSKKWLVNSLLAIFLGGGRIFLQVHHQELIGEYPIISKLWLALATWFLVIGAIGLASRFINRKNKIVSYFVDASYFLYIVHLPVVVTIQFCLLGVKLNWAMKFLIVNVVTLLIIVPLYHFLVKGKLIERILKGKVSYFSFPSDSFVYKILRPNQQE